MALFYTINEIAHVDQPLVTVFDHEFLRIAAFEAPDQVLTRALRAYDQTPLIHTQRPLESLQEMPVQFVGTDFQRRVWACVSEIPRGEVRTYTEIAAEIGKPQAARAVGNALNTNPVAYFVPCHRVVHKQQTPEGYRWGAKTKQQLLHSERILRAQR